MADHMSARAVTVVDVYDGITAGSIGSAPVDADGNWHLEVSVSAPNTYTFTAEAASEVSNEWTLKVEKPFRDYTDFVNGDMRGWVRGLAGQNSAVHSGDTGWFLDCPTPGKEGGYKGVVLSKTFSELEAGKSYRFEIRTWQLVTPGKPQAVLSLATATADITGTFLPQGIWTVSGGEFIAGDTVTELRVISHEDSGEGNDYRLTGFLIEEVLYTTT